MTDRRDEGPLRHFPTVARIEGVTYLVLVAAAVVDRVGSTDLVAGPGLLHGLVFLVYAAMVAAFHRRESWGAVLTVQLLAASFLPFGAFWAERRVAVARA